MKRMEGGFVFSRVLPLVVIAVVVAASGCTNTGSTVSFGPGVSIVTWEPELKNQDYNSGDRVKLLLKVKNLGEMDAKDVRAKVYGIDLSSWGGTWSDEEDLGDLKAANEQYGTEGESRTKNWILEAPDLPKGTDVVYEPKVRVSYDYRTVATKPVTIVDREELRNLINQGKSIPSESTKYTAGPLSVEISTGNFIKTGGRDPYMPIHISIKNSGNGIVSSEGYGGFGWGGEYDYPVEVSVKLPDSMSITGGEDCDSSGKTVEMWGGKEAEITCEVSVMDVDISQKDVIEVDVDYRYQVDATTRVRVIGTDSGF